jgi:hypothetical protein
MHWSAAESGNEGGRTRLNAVWMRAAQFSAPLIASRIEIAVGGRAELEQLHF